ncbi:MAG: LacI family transcriptional regulator [Lachnospiraceae bacterium]|nr:LacI family transcriptional regulator [Lachnospiraceae bacterium]
MDQVTSIKEIAQMCGVSVSTVSRVLNGKSYVKEDTRNKVMEAVEKSGFRPNLLARSLKKGNAKTICLMLPTFGNLIFPEILRGVNSIATQNGYTAFFNITDEHPGSEEMAYNEMRNLQVAGFIICSAIGDENPIYRIREDGVPLVLVNRFQKEDISRLSTVSVDNYRVGYVSTQYLIRSGRKRIAIACGDTELYLYTERLRGYCDALRDAGRKVDEALILQEPAEGHDGFYDMTKKIMLSENPPDAFFATADPKAFVIMRALHDLKLQIPHDVSVVGVDNVELASYMEPPLTTVGQPLNRMGEEAMRMLLDQIEYKKQYGELPPPENRVLNFDLIVRKSTE